MTSTLTARRCDRAAGEDAVNAAARRNRRSRQPKHTYTQASRQERWRRTGRRQCPDGVLFQVWCHDKDYCQERGRKRVGSGDCIAGLRLGKLALRIHNTTAAWRGSPGIKCPQGRRVHKRSSRHCCSRTVVAIDEMDGSSVGS